MLYNFMMKQLNSALLLRLFVGIFIFCFTPSSLFAAGFDLDELSFKHKPQDKPPSKYSYQQYIEYGSYYLQKQLYQEAKDEFWKAIELFPDNPDAYVNLALVYIGQQEYDNAIRVLAKAEQLAPSEYPQSEILFYNLGLAYFYNNDYPKALDYLKKALSVYPGFGEALLCLGLCYDKMNDPAAAFLNIFEARYIFEQKGLSALQKQAEELLQDLSKRPGLDTVAMAQHFYGRARAALDNEDDVEKAIYLLQESVFLNPQYVDAYYQLAMLYSRKNAPHNAIAYLMRILEADPNNTNAYVSLAYAYREMHRYEQALQYLEKALELDKNNATILYDIGMTYFQAKSQNSAKKYFTQSRKLALAEKNLFLVEKIDEALKQMDRDKEKVRRPVRAPKPLLPKTPRKIPQLHYAIEGNRGELGQGYFIPQKEPESGKTKPHAIISSEHFF